MDGYWVIELKEDKSRSLVLVTNNWVHGIGSSDRWPIEKIRETWTFLYRINI